MKWFAPEVVQTSNMDCGPASLKCLLEGFGTTISYGRLREACQTDVDGTSIDTMETLANQFGLEAEQIMVPSDHILLASSKVLPAIVVVRLPNGLTHFVVVWRTIAGIVQLMDPATGRRWSGGDRFLKELYIHSVPVPAAGWREFAVSDEFTEALRTRMRILGISQSAAGRMRQDAAKNDSWQAMAALDAAVRLTGRLVQSGGAKSGSSAARLVERFRARPELIPARYWSVRAHSPDGDGEEQVLMRGAVLVRVRGKRATPSAQSLGPELAAALAEKPSSPGRELLQLLGKAGWWMPCLLLPALVLAAGGAITEAVLFRSLLDLPRELGLPGQRIVAIAAVITFSAALLLLEAGIVSSVWRLGRQMENRLRIAFLRKIPRLGDRYFQSRLISDMAQRSHTTHRLRNLPELMRQLLRLTCEFGATAAGLVWLRPESWPIVLLIVTVGLIPAFIAQSGLAERDLRVRSHAAALTRFHLDALLGLVALRAHGAAPGLRREHESLLGDWTGASFSLQKMVLGLQAIQLFSIFGLVIWLLAAHFPRGGEVGATLLLVYWALNLTTLGQDIGVLARQYPYYRSLTLRLVEPLGAPEEPEPVAEIEDIPRLAPRIEFRSVSVEAAGHTILRDITLDIEAGSHIAIVGPSGAGKSSLAGVLLGWLKPKHGMVLVDGVPLVPDALRQRTAWVDPAVQLWNRSLLSNLTYSSKGEIRDVGQAIDASLLRHVLENLPEGLQSALGEGGGLVSGGEGQRVRLARAMLRDDVRLVILDEPFRGLDRRKRGELLKRAREIWSGCTLLCITHDLEETREFDRVLVVEQGCLVEDGSPAFLATLPGSRYQELIAAEARVRSQMWSSKLWRRVRIHSGRLIEDGELPDDEYDPQERAVAEAGW
jgi:ABC-type bacteriocin/lantibiotic exporter with double-glycine peptidase domain